MKETADIFTVEGGNLVLNKQELRTIPEFKVLIGRDRGGKIPGDHDGRKKLFAFKECMFIHLYYHPLSMYRDLSKEKRYKKAIQHAKLPNDWKPDEVVENAAEKYLELLELSALHHTYLNSSRAIYSMGEEIEFFTMLRIRYKNEINKALKQLDSDDILAEDKERLEGIVQQNTMNLMEMASKLQALSDKLPKAFDSIEVLKEKLLKEGGGVKQVYGGGTVGRRES